MVGGLPVNLKRDVTGVMTRPDLLRSLWRWQAGANPDLARHARRVALCAYALSVQMGLGPGARTLVAWSALLHDVGKLLLPGALLAARGPLSPAQRAAMRRHARRGQEFLRQIPGLATVAAVVGQHHERHDGRGYPHGLAAADICLPARIIAVADALDVMLVGRPYAPAQPLAGALAELDRCSGQQFDPEVVAALRRVMARAAGRGEGGPGEAAD